MPGSIKSRGDFTPLVQCLTNSVVQQITANALLAADAAPAMVDHPVEAAEFAEVADAVLINVGTLADIKAEGMRNAAKVTHRNDKPWVIDPVAVGGLSVRTAFVNDLLELNPMVIRGNASEIAVLAQAGDGGRGVDSTDAVEAVIDPAIQLAERTGAIIAISGATDAVISTHNGKPRVTRVRGGHPVMQKVVGTGCSLGALTAAEVARARRNDATDHDGVVAAHALASGAGSLAARKSTLPGSFHIHWIDALGQLSVEDSALASVEVEDTI